MAEYFCAMKRTDGDWYIFVKHKLLNKPIGSSAIGFSGQARQQSKETRPSANSNVFTLLQRVLQVSRILFYQLYDDTATYEPSIEGIVFFSGAHLCCPFEDAKLCTKLKMNDLKFKTR